MFFVKKIYNIYKKNQTFNTKHTIIQKAESKDKKETRNITRMKEKEIDVATMSFVQSMDIICSSCSVIYFLDNRQMLLVVVQIITKLIYVADIVTNIQVNL